MTDEIRPIPPVDRRDGQRRERDRRASGRAVAVVAATQGEDGPAPSAGRPAAAAAPTDPAAAFSAQLLGQKGQRRGLKGGPVVMDAARSAYLGTEFSGARDRRPRTGERDDSEV